MSTDLRTRFDRAGRDAPPSRVDLHSAMARGRRLRTRQRAFMAAAAALVTAAAALLGTLAFGDAGTRTGEGPTPVGRPTPPASATASASRTTQTARPAVSANRSNPAAAGSHARASTSVSSPKPSGRPPRYVQVVRLPDPAPAFPLRLRTDRVVLTSDWDLTDKWLGTGPRWLAPPRWAASFEVGRPATPAIQASPSTQVRMTILVGKFPLPTLPGTNPNLQGLYFTTTTVRIAGVKGYVTHWGRKEIWGDDAYFTKHGMTVVMMSSSWPQVPSTEQFIDLGNALTGL